MLLDMLSAFNAVRLFSPSGIETKRFCERSRETREFASGRSDSADIVVRELSARHRCFKNLHLFEGNCPKLGMLIVEDAKLGCCIVEVALEWLLPEPERFILVVVG